MLLYTADLKLPRCMPYKDKVRKVSLIISQLALTTCQHVRIGSSVQRGISGERSLPSFGCVKQTPVMHLWLMQAQLGRQLEQTISIWSAWRELLSAAESCNHLGVTRLWEAEPLFAADAGGQCKRTNIGIALVSDPKVLFMDEPTSGLDSFTANEVSWLMFGID